jgi:hypothetical protein
MVRPVTFLSLLFVVILTACGGIRFLPYGEEVPTGTGPVIRLVLETPFPPSASPDEPTEATLPTAVPASPTAGVSEPTVEATSGEAAESSGPTTVTEVPPTVVFEPTVIATPVEPAPLVLEERKPYRIQPGSPVWLPNFIHPEAGCNWIGVAGQVFDKSGNPVTSLVVEIGGELNGIQVQSLSLTGVAPAYGPGGYEVYLGDQAVDSISALWLQLKDLSGEELTDRVSFDTFSDCSRNLVLINFVETSFEIEVIEYFFPLFYNGVTGSVRRASEEDVQGEDQATNQIYFPLFYNRYLPESTAPPSP